MTDNPANPGEKGEESTQESTQADHFGEKRAPLWKSGQSGNPKGTKKGAKWGARAKIRSWLKKQAPARVVEIFRKSGTDLKKGTNAEVLAEVLGDLAIGGDVPAIKVILDQTEPPLPKSIEHSGPDGGAIVTQTTGIDLSKLTEDELAALTAIMERHADEGEGEG